MEKFFVDNSQVFNEYIHIGKEDANHIKKVLRKRVEDKICITVNQEKTFLCKIEQFDNDAVICKIIEQIFENTETTVNITLFQCIAKYDKMDDIIQKATQLGVKDIYPVISDRVVVKLDEQTKIKKVDRWNKIAQEASKQCKRTIIPNVENVIFLTNICNLIPKYDIILLAYENESIALKQVLQKCARKKLQNIGIIIGPEGGFETNEVSELVKYDNVYSISLGNRILRTETASIVLVSNILYELGEV